LAGTDDLATVEDLRLLIEDHGTLRDLAPGDPMVGAQKASRGYGLRLDDTATLTDDAQPDLQKATRVLVFESDRATVTIALAETPAGRAKIGDRRLVMLVIGARREQEE